ncbi:MAG TPA: putative zinc-binding metallopeptidase [Gemmatimonadota bacterium]|nr:putative zinc-binding metallopeptidase [Gemmatimonadota bacterium]
MRTTEEGARPERREQPADSWEQERDALLGRRISDLGLRVQGSPVERLVERLYAELAERGLLFRPPVYLTDEWGCPEGVAAIGVPFFLADRRLERLERERAVALEEEDDPMKIMRHEAGHAFNYAYRLHERPEWRQLFGPYSRPYRDRFRVDPFSRGHVRHILGWYAQKHPDEDFAETFAVWLTPGLDWRARYEGWPALRKLEYVDAVMADVGGIEVAVPRIRAEHLPVEVMRTTLGEHYAGREALPLGAPSHFDGDLRTLFPGTETEGAAPAGRFIQRHRRELVRRIAYWTGETTYVVRQFVDHLLERAEALELTQAGGGEETLIELTAFSTAVIMNYRYTDQLGHDMAEDT